MQPVQVGLPKPGREIVALDTGLPQLELEHTACEDSLCKSAGEQSAPPLECGALATDAPLRTDSAGAFRWDLFCSHRQQNAQDAVISLLQFLRQAHPGLRCFIDLEVDMKGQLEETLYTGVMQSRVFLFFITDGVLNSKWCLQEIRWAVQACKPIVLVRETDERHGGLPMNHFLSQVPSDLLQTFRNIIAIPWYREPQYRDVSIKSILQASELRDTFASDLELMKQTSSQLQKFFTPDPQAFTVVDVMSENSRLMSCVFFLGGFTHFKQPMLDRVYATVFAFSFWFCGFLCTVNLVYQGVPYHIFSTDALTAYVHFVGWHGWRTWRHVVNGTELEELLTNIKQHKGNKILLGKASRIFGAVVMIIQVGMVADVLLGFSLPYEVLKARGAIDDNVGHPHTFHTLFVEVHARSMWFVIPPVIAAIFCSYSLFAFVAILHLLDIEALKDRVVECCNIVTRLQLKRGSSSKDDASSTPTEMIAQDLQDFVNRHALETKLFMTVSEQLYLGLRHTQGHIDSTCCQLGWLWLHLVFFSTCQVFAILIGIRSHIYGILQDVPYQWWWGLQDFFHLGGGLVLLTAALGILTSVTTSLQRVPLFAVELLRDAGCPSDRLGMLSGLLDSRPLGMHVFYQTIYIDMPKAVGFFLLLFATILTTAITIASALDMRSPPNMP